MKTQDRILGSLFGCAIGDALGYPVEFMNIPGGSDIVKDLDAKALYSDDTQMTVAIAKALLDYEAKHDEDDTREGFVKCELILWSHHPDTPGRAPGNSCLHGCRNLENGVAWNLAGKPDSTGCGAVMRSAPYGWFYFAEPGVPERMAGQHALMTHISPEAQGSSAALAAGVAAALAGRKEVEIVNQMIESARRFSRHTASLIEIAERMVQWGVKPKEVLDLWRGWQGQEAIAVAVYCFLTHPHDYEEAVLLAVNSPGDSDSLGAITGALSGAYVGLQGIPAAWIEQIENSDMLSELGQAIAKRVEKDNGSEPRERDQRQHGSTAARNGGRSSGQDHSSVPPGAGTRGGVGVPAGKPRIRLKPPAGLAGGNKSR